jgi:hypothetical protein
MMKSINWRGLCVREDSISSGAVVWFSSGDSYTEMIQLICQWSSVDFISAVCYFMKTNNLEPLRKLVGHQDLKTTLIYLQSLGLYNNDINADDIPDF